MSQLDATNSSTIACLVDEAMIVLWPTGKHPERVLLLLSDAAPYMVKAGENLIVFFPNMIHATCLAHPLHRVAKIIRFQVVHANTMVSNVRKSSSKLQSAQRYTRDVILIFLSQPNLFWPDGGPGWQECVSWQKTMGKYALLSNGWTRRTQPPTPLYKVPWKTHLFVKNLQAFPAISETS